MQSYLLFSPPSNTFPHLPRTSACPTPPRANAGHPNCRKLTALWWVCFATAQLAWDMSAGSQQDTCCGQGQCAPPRAARPALADCRHVQPLPIPPTDSLGFAQAVMWQYKVVLLGWSFQEPAPPEPTQDPTLSSSQGT